MAAKDIPPLMSIHADNISDTGIPTTPAVLVAGLSFCYRSLDDETEPHRNKSAALDTDTPLEQPRAIEDISFTLPVGELMLIAGPSGCGKSTLLKCLNGLIPNSYHGVLSGEIQLGGRTIKGSTLRDLALQVGTMLQDPDKQIIASTVEQEIAFGMENMNTPRAEMQERIAGVLEQLHLEHYKGKATFALSGGQRQQVAAAGILVMNPSLYLLDEPCANLDARAVDELEELIAGLRARGHTVIIVEHRVEEALRLKPDKVLLMKDGRQVFFGSTRDFLGIADPTQVKLPIESTLRTVSDPAEVRALFVKPITTGVNNVSAQDK